MKESKQKEMITTCGVDPPRKSSLRTQPKSMVYPYGNSCPIFRVYRISRRVSKFHFKRHAKDIFW